MNRFPPLFLWERGLLRHPQRERGFNAVPHRMDGRNSGHAIALLKVLER